MGKPIKGMSLLRTKRRVLFALSALLVATNPVQADDPMLVRAVHDEVVGAKGNPIQPAPYAIQPGHRKKSVRYWPGAKQGDFCPYNGSPKGRLYKTAVAIDKEVGDTPYNYDSRKDATNILGLRPTGIIECSYPGLRGTTKSTANIVMTEGMDSGRKPNKRNVILTNEHAVKVKFKGKYYTADKCDFTLFKNGKPGQQKLRLMRPHWVDTLGVKISVMTGPSRR